jgi:hypothetical protein
MDANQPKPRRWFRFSLRTLFVLVTVLCVWLGDQLNWIGQRHDAMEWLKCRGQVCEKGIGLACGCTGKVPRAPFPLNLMGETGVLSITFFREDLQSDEPKAFRLSRLFPEAEYSVLTEDDHL